MYKYETHLHTSPCSRCARASVEDSLAFYKSMGYDGVFITNHFFDGSMSPAPDNTYEGKINFFFSDYEHALDVGAKLGIKVFGGVETSYKGTDFLVYGLDKAWFLAHPEIVEMERSDFLTLMRESGALIIQAHPFHEAPYIDHIRLFPRHVHGVEIVNAGHKDEHNRMAKLYAEHYGLIPFAGSDNHFAGEQRRLAGVEFDEPIDSVEEFIAAVKSGAAKVFTLINEG